jgi:hypothetical protein
MAEIVEMAGAFAALSDIAAALGMNPAKSYEHLHCPQTPRGESGIVEKEPDL